MYIHNEESIIIVIAVCVCITVMKKILNVKK